MKFILNLMIFLPSIGALACLFAPTKDAARKTALGICVAAFAMSLILLTGFFGSEANEAGVWFESSTSWISSINVFYRTGLDGLSLPLVLLTTALSILVVLASWSIDKNAKAFMALYLFLLTGMLGVFLSLDMFLFYVFFEISLLPMYFLIGVWGGPRKEYAAIKFFLYTLAGSICLLIVMLGLFFYSGEATGGNGNTWHMMALQGKTVTETRTDASGKEVEVKIDGKNIAALFKGPDDLKADQQAQGNPAADTPAADATNTTTNTTAPTAADPGAAQAAAAGADADDGSGKYWGFAKAAFWLTLIAFMIKLPGVPFHTWLPDAHVEAPTPISMVLAGVLLKMGGYAMMRITWPIFPEAAYYFWGCVAFLGVVAIIYGAFCAMAQTDWKKLVAYSSVSHMGYVTLGIAVMTTSGWNGAYFQMIAHGISSAMMFFMVGVLYERAHHRDLNRLGGMWLRWPKYGAWSLVAFFAGMGLPGLCGFIGEILVLLGTFEAAGTFDAATVYTYGIFAAFGVVLTAGYILWMFQRVYMGKDKAEYDGYATVNKREYAIMAVMGIAAIVFGIVPALVFNITDGTFKALMQTLGAAG